MISRHTLKGGARLFTMCLLCLAVLSADSRADIFGFTAISSNSGVQNAVAQQLSVEVTPYGTDDDQVLFTFGNYFVDPYNSGTAVPSEIGTVFFEDGALLGIATVINTSGLVEFTASTSGKPKMLPDSGDLDPPFYTSADFWADMDHGLGVDPTESLGVVFDLLAGYGFADVIAAINLGFEQPNASLSPDYDPSLPPSLRIGLHVQSLGLDGEDSDSFIATPVPGAALLGCMGLSVAGHFLRRRRDLA